MIARFAHLDWTALARQLTARASGRPDSALVSATATLADPPDRWLEYIPADLPYWYEARPAAGEFHLGICEAIHLASRGSQRFAALDGALRGLLNTWRHDEMPRLQLGFAFAEDSPPPFPNALLAVPLLALVCRQDGCRLTVTVPAGQLARLLPTLPALLRPHPVAPQATRLRPPLQTATDSLWADRVQDALTAISEGSLEKVVLTRSETLLADRAISIPALLAALIDGQAGATVFAHGRDGQHFLGATPETLVSLQDGQLRADALAGTAWGQTSSLGDDKNQREQALVVTAVREALAPYCPDLACQPAPAPLQAGQVRHLHTTVGGWARPGTRLFDLLAALHPTPAVGGYPREAALAWLTAQGEQRPAWYTGGFGHLDGQGNGRVVVPLRCALVRGKTVELQAGAGIVAGSDPQQELAETRAKMTTLRDALTLLPDHEKRRYA